MYRLLLILIRFLGPRWELHPIVAEYLSRSQNIGKSEHLPTNLIPLAARLWSRGWFNHQFLDTHRDWILPYWATHQLEPTDRGFVSRALQPVLLNQSYRDWTMIGSPGSSLEAIVDPRGLITPQPNESGWSLDTWLEVNGQLYFPSRLDDKTITQTPYENLPIVQTQYEPARLRVNQQAFAVQDDQGADWVIAAATIENPRGDARRARLYLAVRPFNPEGAAIINHIEIRNQRDAASEVGVWINSHLGVLLPPPNSIAFGNEERGDAQPERFEKSLQLSQITSATGVASATLAYDLELSPHSHRIVNAVLPMRPAQQVSAQSVEWTNADVYPALRRTNQLRWRTLLDQGMKIRVPDDQIQNAFEANKAYLLLFHDGDSITPGPFLYHQFWFRDAAFMLHALDQLGYHNQVKEVLAKYPRRLQKNGYYLAAEGEFDANGEALWTLAEHTRLSGDLELMASQYWQMLNAAHWIDYTRQKTRQPGGRAPEHGLLPAGMSAEHLGPNDLYYWDDFWGLAGLRATAYAANIFGNPGDKEKLTKAYDAFRLDIDASLAAVAARNGAAWMPASPSRGADSAIVANLIALYPLQLVAPDDERIHATLEELKRIAYVDGAFFHHVGHAGFGTYLALHLAGCYLFQRKREAWDAINWLVKHASPTYTWAEAIHPLILHGGHGDGHHGWAAAEFVSIIRNALLFEEGDHLVLTPALPDDWTLETFSIQVQKAATHFGNVDFTLAFGDRNATLVIKGAWRDPPAYIEWNLPMAIKTAGGDERDVQMIDEHRIRIPSNVSKIVAMW